MADAFDKQAAAVAVPEDLEEQIRAVLDENDDLRWDDAVQIVLDETQLEHVRAKKQKAKRSPATSPHRRRRRSDSRPTLTRFVRNRRLYGQPVNSAQFALAKMKARRATEERERARPAQASEVHVANRGSPPANTPTKQFDGKTSFRSVSAPSLWAACSHGGGPNEERGPAASR